ncbi:MAG: hypothetical protein PUG87_05600 [Eubacteriales bacterium]|nr:hypothetical protein [Clostridiales bacterium]MDD7301403.1 hypothetical protein [Eubacteriales bacterium]MDY4434895.1 hypothetical protein [Candidatus Flemingibacterium sp.]
MRRRGNSVLLACLLFALSGAALAYNIWTADSGDVAVSISDLVDQMRDGDIAVGAHAGESSAQIEETADTDMTSESESPETTPRALLPPVVRREEG